MEITVLLGLCTLHGCLWWQAGGCVELVRVGDMPAPVLQLPCSSLSTHGDPEPAPSDRTDCPPQTQTGPARPFHGRERRCAFACWLLRGECEQGRECACMAAVCTAAYQTGLLAFTYQQGGAWSWWAGAVRLERDWRAVCLLLSSREYWRHRVQRLHRHRPRHRVRARRLAPPEAVARADYGLAWHARMPVELWLASGRVPVTSRWVEIRL